ncbi:MAG: hypothetical protein U9O82_13030 [Thermodesulfobacteriota bacterium]|nr:hypothetical protein [Thermodesulfobacteriota bacterium]
MKKVLSTVAALGLVAGMSASASALEWSISGDYTVQGVNLNHTNRGTTVATGLAGPRAGDFNDGPLAGQDDDQNSDAYYWHQFRTDVTMKVNDNIKVLSEIYMIDAYTGWEDTRNNAVGDTTHGNYVNVFKLWMQYTTPFGLFEIGRLPNGQVLNAFTNTDLQGDGIKFSPNLPEPFTLCLVTQKVDENDSVISVGFNDDTDNDYDYYHVSVGYHTENIVADTALRYWDNAVSRDLGVGAPYNQEFWTWWLAADLTFGNFYVEGEFAYTFGNWMDWEDDTLGAVDDIDIDAMSLMLNGGAKFGDLDIGLMYFFLEGQDEDDDNPGELDDDMTAYMMFSGGAGGAFSPYYVLTGPQTAMLNQDAVGNGNIDQEIAAAGIHCLGVHADFQVSPKLTVHGAIAYAWADETDFPSAYPNGAQFGAGTDGDTIDEDGTIDEREDDYGWEIDVGVAYKLLDNLTYSLNIGYLDTGDFFAVAYDAAGDSYETDDTNDILLVTNTLTMEF